MNSNIPQKLGNPSEPPNRVSCCLSDSFIPNTNIPYSLTTNFIDLKGRNPRSYDKISTKNIVFNKEELTEHNWFFTLEEYKDVVKKALDTQQWKWIIIKSNKIRRKIAYKSKLTEQLREQQEIMRKETKRDNFKLEINLLTAGGEYIKEKYRSLAEYQEKNDTGYFPSNIPLNFQDGDEIWYYSQFHLGHVGNLIAAYVLVRNNKIICSPLIIYMETLFMSAEQISEAAKRMNIK